MAIVLIGLPAVFSTTGDKRQVLVPTSGPVPVLIELLLYVVAVAGPWIAWHPIIAVLTTLTVVSALVTGLPRIRWLLRGAPLDLSLGLATTQSEEVDHGNG